MKEVFDLLQALFFGFLVFIGSTGLFVLLIMGLMAVVEFIRESV